MSVFLNKDESDLIRIVVIKYFRIKEKYGYAAQSLNCY